MIEAVANKESAYLHLEFKRFRALKRLVLTTWQKLSCIARLTMKPTSWRVRSKH